jgi:hypothetical protein
MVSWRLAGVAAALLGAACAPDARVSPDDRAQLADGSRLADSLAAASQWDDAGAVALGYLERLRLGLGGPFRLAEQAQADARLPVALGRRTAWALLAAAARGQAYAVDSAALGSDPGALAPGGVVDGGWHRALIDSAVNAARTPRTGEEAVRIAYALASAEGLVTARAAGAAVHAAALSRDRRLAVADVQHLLTAARAVRTATPDADALKVAREWRLSRRFLSEIPLLADTLAPDAAESVALAEALVGRLRQEGSEAALRSAALSPSPAADTAPAASDSARPRPDASRRATPDPAPALTPGLPRTGAAPLARADDPAGAAFPTAAARRLAATSAVRTALPSAPIVVTLGGFRRPAAGDTLADPADSTAELRRVRARLVARARTGELLAAEWAVARAELPAGAARRELAALVQAAAVAVRPWAQAPAVGVAAGAITTRAGAQAEVDAVRARDGLRGIDYDVETPPAWRAGAARQFSDAVADLRGVFPNVSLDGLRVRMGESPRRDLALALHEPATRTVYLPPATGAGTVAHELVHDLDWQAARGRPAAAAGARAGAAGGYQTDRLARTGGQLAQAVRGLGGTRGTASRRSVGAAAPGAFPVDADRPAERLARGADFLVAAALARAGRSNGVLSAVQDRVLTGYAGVVAPEPGDGAAESLVEVLDAVSATDPAARAWYLHRFGAGGVRSPLAVAGFALTALPAWEGERVLRMGGVPGGLAGPENPGIAGTCGVGGGAPAEWQPRLVWLAADARARGLVRARAWHAASVGGAFWGWTARSALGGPWNPDAAESVVGRLRDSILRAGLAEARRAAGPCGVTPVGAARR